jgi:GNAT superfamily N-acetyltransferase
VRISNQICIRKACLEDAPALTDLTGQLGYKISISALTQNIAAYLDDPDRSLLVAEMDGVVVGYLALDAALTFHREEKQARVVSLAVDRIHRGRGLGKLLLESAESWAKEQNGWVVEVTSSTSREKEGTHDFYIKQGYLKNGSQAYFHKLIERGR